MKNEERVAQIDALLPQTQCRRCGYEGCRPYAQAIVQGEADINRCPPGGQAGITRLSRLLARPERPLDPSCGSEKNVHLAYIDAQTCIGCTLCIQACPVDAIVGVSKHLHAVIDARCSGCELCLPPCPVNCISMHEVYPLRKTLTEVDIQGFRHAFQQKTARLQHVAKQSSPNTINRSPQLTLPSPLSSKPLTKKSRLDKNGVSPSQKAINETQSTIAHLVEQAVKRAQSRQSQNQS